MANTVKKIISIIDSENSAFLLNGFYKRKNIIFNGIPERINDKIEWLRDRFKFLVFILSWPLSNLVKGRKEYKSGVVLGSEDDLPKRRQEVRDYFFEDCIQIRRKEYYRSRPTLKYWRFWFKFIWVGICSFFDFRKESVKDLAICLDLCLKCILIEKNIEHFYVYYMVNPCYYLLAHFIDRNCTSDLRIMMEYNYIYLNQYIYLNRAEVYLMIRFQIDEIKYYIEIGKVKVKVKNIYVLNEKPYFEYKKINTLIDIGYLSAGTWARTEGRIQLNTKEEIVENYNNLDKNRPWQMELYYFSKLCQYVQKNNLRLKLYLHPYERRIFREYGLETPFLKYINNINVLLDESKETDSHSKFGEYNVGISVISSSIWQRDNAGYCHNYMYDYNLISDQPEYDKNALGRYGNYIFSNAEELFSLLDDVFVN